eukprot:10706303-Ditylum_brightwellii.AAC.1
MVRKKHFQAEAIIGNDEMDEWYQRDKKNGWREVIKPQTEIMSHIKVSWEIMTKSVITNSAHDVSAAVIGVLAVVAIVILIVLVIVPLLLVIVVVDVVHRFSHIL